MHISMFTNFSDSQILVGLLRQIFHSVAVLTQKLYLNSKLPKYLRHLLIAFNESAVDAGIVAMCTTGLDDVTTVDAVAVDICCCFYAAVCLSCEGCCFVALLLWVLWVLTSCECLFVLLLGGGGGRLL